MTNREKAESCGEFVRDGLLVLADNHKWAPAWQNDPVMLSNSIVDGARQAGHWGRLALADRIAQERRRFLRSVRVDDAFKVSQ